MIVNGSVFLIYFISSWLHQTFLAAHGPPPGAASRGCRLVAKHGLLTLRSVGSRALGLSSCAHGLSRRSSGAQARWL